MAPSHRHQDIVGNRVNFDQMMGWTFPLPEDDTWSCDEMEKTDLGILVEQDTNFDAEPKVTNAPLSNRCPTDGGSAGTHSRGYCEGDISQTTPGASHFWGSRHTTRDCRAASGSEALDHTSVTSVGAQTQASLDDHSHGTTQDKGIMVAGDMQQLHSTFQPQQRIQGLAHHSSEPAAPHGPWLKITGGASAKPSSTFDSGRTQPNMSSHYYASTTDLLLQNLSMVVGNPSARCFANAPWRAFCWMCAYLAEFNRDPWGVIKDAVQTSLELSEPVDIQRLPGLHQLWQKHDLNIEGDAAHFVHSLWVHSQTRVLQYRHTEVKEGGYVTEHIQVPLIVDYPDEYLDEITWQELMSCWANQGLGQYLSDDKLVQVSHINRAVTIEGTVTKHKRALNPHGPYTVPRSLDGFSRASTEYIPMAYICHRGPTHETEHYYTILVYKDLMWIADDGGTPKVLQFLTPQIAGQIVQVWGIQTSALITPRQIARALPPPETPDYDPPLHGTPPDKARHTQDNMRLHVGNIAFGKSTLDWYWTRDNEIYIMVETHLDRQKHQTMCQYFEVRGRHAFGYPAHANSNNDGTHGGIIAIYDTAHGLTQLEAFDIEGCGYQAFLWEAKARTILVVAVYFKTNETIQGTTNSQILARILALLQATTRQFILVGDWNNHPEHFQSTVLSSKFHWQILAPDATLLNGNTVDYAIMHQTLAACASMTTEWAVPWRPHCLLTYALELEDDFRLYHQLRTFPPLPNVPDIGFRAWSTYITQVEQLQLYESTPNQGAKGLADRVSVTEQYLLQQHPWAQGRASSLTTQHLPLVPAAAAGIWKKGKAAFWEQIQARLTLIQHQPAKAPGATHGLNKALQQVQHHWLGDQTWGQFLDTHQHWLQYRDDRTFELMQQTVQHQLETAQQQSREEASLQYAEWIRQGETKGLKGLFRSLKASELSWQRPYRNIPVADRMRHRMHDWHVLWKPTRDNQPMTRLPLQEEAKQQAAQLPPLTYEQLGKTLRHLPDRACGPDAITTQLLRTAPKQAIQPLLSILQDMEAKAELPTQLTMSLVVMLAKNEKVERPITLTSVLCRVWCRMRKPLLDEWQRTLPPTMDVTEPDPEPQPYMQETAKSLERHGVTVLLDMSTFYDTLDLQKLQQTAQDLSYPPLALEFAMQVYTGHKAILAEGELSPWFHVTTGVPLLAKTFLQPILTSFQQQYPDLRLNGWVDDIGFDGSHTNAQHLAQRSIQAWHHLRDKLTEAVLRVNSQKTAFIVTDKHIHADQIPSSDHKIHQSRPS